MKTTSIRKTLKLYTNILLAEKRDHLIAPQQWGSKVNIQLSVRGLEHVNKERANLAPSAGPEVISSRGSAKRGLKWSNTQTWPRKHELKCSGSNLHFIFTDYVGRPCSLGHNPPKYSFMEVTFLKIHSEGHHVSLNSATAPLTSVTSMN